MDIYTNPPPNTYVTGITRQFTMPTDSGGIPAVTVSSRAANFFVSAYTILILLIFMVGWNLILAVIMGFWRTHRNPNRYIALVALWNSAGSMNAAVMMLEYCVRMISGRKAPESTAGGIPTSSEGQRSGPGGQDTIENEKSRTTAQTPQKISESPTPNRKLGASNLWWGILFFFIAFAVSVGSIVAGILVSGGLVVGKVAPPAKDSIFYPDVTKYARTDDNGASLAKLDTLKAPSALRALGCIESSDVTARKRVNLRRANPPGGRADEPSTGIDYDYDVTGVDMGLQTEPKLRLHVIGSCQTNYTWLANSTDAGDTYRLFGGDQLYLAKFQPEVDSPPTVSLRINTRDIGPGSDRISFAMIVNTGGLYSYTSGTDPWYFTEPTNLEGLAYQVRRKRPVLSCWETSRWHLDGKDVETSKLDTLPGLSLHKVWIDVFKFEFALPRMVSLARLAGTSALKSASFAAAPSYILDAGASSIRNDIERLVLGSWASSANVLRDTTTYAANGMVNFVKGEKGSVEDSAAKFVLKSGDVSTLSVRILISIPFVLLFLLVVMVCLNCVLRRRCLRKPSIFRDYATRGIALQATQLYRYLDEELYGRARWSHRLAHIPAMYESYDEEGLKLPVDEEAHPIAPSKEPNESAEGRSVES
ncbi:hypothetical protein HOY80DRAFT_1018395 [Tuber brumale]|nr:hypothetical protein HOY80DRAFT_1018395 [Tuber brumale]